MADTPAAKASVVPATRALRASFAPEQRCRLQLARAALVLERCRSSRDDLPGGGDTRTAAQPSRDDQADGQRALAPLLLLDVLHARLEHIAQRDVAHQAPRVGSL